MTLPTFAKIFLFLPLLLPIMSCASLTASKENEAVLASLKILIPDVSESPQDFADKQLTIAGLSQTFIDQIHKNYLGKNEDWANEAIRIIELNVFGFLAQSNYALHDTPLAHRKIKQYLKDHHSSFRDARKKFAVSSTVIASLMWVETRHGKTMGTFPMPWVFYSLVLGSHPEFIKAMIAMVPEKLAKHNPKNLSLQEAQQKVIERCKSKADWATSELKAVYQIQIEKNFDPFKRKSSFAGAFGMAQFIPSSYLKFAVSGYRRKPDLFKHSDAVLSIANFLTHYGWKPADSETQIQALYNYNRSKDYGAIILKLAADVSAKSTQN